MMMTPRHLQKRAPICAYSAKRSRSSSSPSVIFSPGRPAKSFAPISTLTPGMIPASITALIKGVPFTSANTARQYNAGLDVINTLSKHYEVVVPLFIDNRESINQLIETESQVINLIVSLDKNLIIESEDI